MPDPTPPDDPDYGRRTRPGEAPLLAAAIDKAEKTFAARIRKLDPGAQISHLGVFDIFPSALGFWVVTSTDAERDLLSPTTPASRPSSATPSPPRTTRPRPSSALASLRAVRPMGRQIAPVARFEVTSSVFRSIQWIDRREEGHETSKRVRRTSSARAMPEWRAHDNASVAARDAEHYRWLAGQNIRVLRIAAGDILNDDSIDGVLTAIEQAAPLPRLRRSSSP